MSSKNHDLKVICAVTAGLTIGIPLLQNLSEVIDGCLELVKGKINKHVLNDNIKLNELKDQYENSENLSCENASQIGFMAPDEEDDDEEDIEPEEEE